MPTVVDEADWSPKPVLRPGMDFHEGVTYYTIPLTRRLMHPAKKGHDPVPYTERQTYVVTSQHTGFWYDETDLALEGFLRAEQEYPEEEANWSPMSAKAWLDDEATPPTTADIFARVRQVYTTHIEFADEIAYDLMSLYVLYTYVFRLFSSTGYVHFNGTAASGKSVNLSVLKGLGFNTVWAANMSAASLYRKLAGNPGVICIDESEGFDGERGEELRRILNAGYLDGSKVTRTEKNAKDRFVAVSYDVFAPKALASIKPLESVIASRCIVITMRPALRQLPPFDFRDAQWQTLRDDLYLWAMTNAPAIEAAVNEWHGGKHAAKAPRLRDRQWQTTSQFVVMADIVGGDALAERVVEYLNGYFGKQQKAADASDRIRTTLRCLPRVLATKMAFPGSQYSLKDIHEVVSGFLEEDARDAFKSRHVGTNLASIGFTDRVRAAGGMRVMLDEDAIRAEFTQRRVDPFPEDEAWLAGTVSYQHPTVAKEWYEESDEDDA